MIGDLEKYSEGNRLEVNAGKTKVMVFKNGGRRKKEEKWYYKGRELEIINEYKYLGFWFSNKNI